MKNHDARPKLEIETKQKSLENSNDVEEGEDCFQQDPDEEFSPTNFHTLTVDEILEAKIKNTIRIKGTDAFFWTKTIDKHQVGEYLFENENEVELNKIYEKLVPGKLMPIRQRLLYQPFEINLTRNE